MTSISSLTRFCNLNRFIDDICMIQIAIIMDHLYQISDVIHDPFISHVDFNNVALIVTLLSTRSDNIANII